MAAPVLPAEAASAWAFSPAVSGLAMASVADSCSRRNSRSRSKADLAGVTAAGTALTEGGRILLSVSA